MNTPTFAGRVAGCGRKFRNPFRPMIRKTRPTSTRAVAGKKRPTDRASLRPDEDVACVIFYLSFSAVLSASPATALDGNIQALPTRRASRSGIDTKSEQIPLPPLRTTVREVIYFSRGHILLWKWPNGKPHPRLAAITVYQ